MITFGRRGGSLLIGLTFGGLLVGSMALASPVGVLPANSATALGTTAPEVSTTTPGPVVARSIVPLAEVPLVTAVPATTTTAPATTGPATTGPPTTRPRPTAEASTPRPAAAPRPAADPPPAAPAPSGPIAAVVALTNDARADVGCAPLRTDSRIAAAAQAHSADMSGGDYFSHDSQDGRSFADRIRDAGYPSPGAENIAQGQRSAAEVVQAWLDSPGHRRNIEDCSLATIGVGLAGDDFYWTQDFGR